MKDRAYIIAEAGVNHNGSMKLAKRLIDAAADAGADAVKFQTFKADHLASQRAPKAAYQKRTTDASESQHQMLKKLEMDQKSHEVLMKHSETSGIQFLSTPFDMGSLDLLVKALSLPTIKISSGDITYAPLLVKVGQSGRKVILSTGMSTLAEVETALAILAFGHAKTRERPSLTGFRKAYVSSAGQRYLKDRVMLLHCTSEYPAAFGDVHLRAMDTLRSAFGLPVGLSDHTTGIAVPIAAAARGAAIIEKHFTLDKMLPGPDHRASVDPPELKAMIVAIRQIELALGVPLKRPSLAEVRNSALIRKSLVAMKTIRKGEHFSEENIAVKRPGSGTSPLYYWEWVGKVATKDYDREDEIP